jgi:ubiquinone/menaquinone biosynthesis C-methylase UbiE
MRVTQNNLPDDFGSPSVFYSQFYKSVIFGKGLGPWSVRKTHQSMEKAYSGCFFEKVLEIGGGIGEHLNFVLHDYEKYFLTDINLPVLEDGRKDDPRVICEVQNAEDDSFDRIIVTCLLHHVDKPEIVMKEIQRVLKPGGSCNSFFTL